MQRRQRPTRGGRYDYLDVWPTRCRDLIKARAERGRRLAVNRCATLAAVIGVAYVTGMPEAGQGGAEGLLWTACGGALATWVGTVLCRHLHKRIPTACNDATAWWLLCGGGLRWWERRRAAETLPAVCLIVDDFACGVGGLDDWLSARMGLYGREVAWALAADSFNDDSALTVGDIVTAVSALTNDLDGADKAAAG